PQIVMSPFNQIEVSPVFRRGGGFGEWRWAVDDEREGARARYGDQGDSAWRDDAGHGCAAIAAVGAPSQTLVSCPSRRRRAGTVVTTARPAEQPAHRRGRARADCRLGARALCRFRADPGGRVLVRAARLRAQRGNAAAVDGSGRSVASEAAT